MRMLKTTATLAVLWLLAAPAWAATYNDGLKLMKAERYREAIPIFEREARLNPGSADVLMNLGWAYWHVHDYEQSWKIWDLLSKLDPRNPTYMRQLAELEDERKRYDKALALTDQALAVAPDDRDTLLVKAKTLDLLDRDPEASKILDDLLRRYPDSPAVLYANADHLAAHAQLDAALELFDRLVHIAPNGTAYRRGRAGVLFRLGHYDEAVYEWKQLAAQDPPDDKSILNLGWAAWSRKDFDAAVAYGRRLLSLFPESPSYLRFMASIDLEVNNPGESLELAQKALSVDPKDEDLRLIKAKALFQLEHDDEAIALLKQLLAEYPDQAKLKFNMADFLAAMGRVQEALKYFDELVEEDPGNFVYHRERAQARYDAQRFDEAVAEWKEMTRRYPVDPTAFEALLADAENRQDWADALAWTRQLAGAKPLSAFDWYRLSKVYEALNLPPEALAAARKAMETDPTLLGATFHTAELLDQEQRWPESRRIYEQALSENSNSTRALFSLAHVYEAEGDLPHAVKIFDTIKKKFFAEQDTPPYIVMYQARLIADEGHVERAYRILRRLERRGVRAMPAILYHGISLTDRSDVVSQALFREQMKALAAKGYTAVTVPEYIDYLKGRGRLPDKPILITFDDGRIDAFQNGDPVLKETGMRATMFLIFGAKRTRFHAGIGQLRQYHDTGRWAMEVHAGHSHVLAPIDNQGHSGHYLTNRLWLPKAQRLETTEEMEQRLDADYKQAKERLLESFPETKRFAFAFPFGDYGQDDWSNEPDAPAINQRMMEKYFDAAFVEDQYGFNVDSAKRWELSRFEVPKDMSGSGLIKHLDLDNPANQVRMLEAEMWMRTGQPKRALPIYDALSSGGVDEPELVSERGVAYERAGNSWMGHELYAQATQADPVNPYYHVLSAQNEANRQPHFDTSGDRLSDSAGRINSLALGKVMADAGPAEFGGWAGLGRYEETNFSAVSAKTGGASAGVFVVPKVQLAGQLEHRVFDFGRQTTADNFQGEVNYLAFHGMRLTGGAGRANVETASAIQDGLYYRSYFGNMDYDIAMNWDLTAAYDKLRYNDANNQWDTRAQLMRKFARNLSAGYAMWTGNADRLEPNYWTPKNLQQHLAVVAGQFPFGATYETTGKPKYELRAQLGAGYGWDASVGRAVENAQAGATWRPDDYLAVTLGYQLLYSPTYDSHDVTAGVSLSY